MKYIARKIVVTAGRITFAAVLDLCPDLMLTVPGYSNLSWIMTSFGFLRSKNSIRMCMIITIIMLNMKNKSQKSASLNPDDFGKDVIKDDKREAKTRNPVMAPINLLLKSLISMNRVKYTRNQRTNV